MSRLRVTDRGSKAHIGVLHSAPHPGINIGFVNLISASERIDAEYFTWRVALTRTFDVFHVHWPEALVKGASLRRPDKVARFVILLLLLRLRRTVVVRTLHNLTPHEAVSKLEGRLLRLLEGATDAFVTLNPYTPSPVPARTTMIPHGGYGEGFARFEKGSPIPGRLLYFGLIRPYKGVESLLDAFGELLDESVSLRLVGKPRGGFGERLQGLAARDPRVSLALAFVDDEVLVHEISSATAIVLPYESMHNSGSLFAALSLQRRVLAPATPVNRWIAEEVGASWLRLYEGRLSPEHLRELLEDTGDGGADEEVRLQDRSWSTVSSQHLALYVGTIRRRTSTR